MGTVLIAFVILAAAATIASGVWVATGLISAMLAFKAQARALKDAERHDHS